ncbi:MFS transporter [Candidatus Bathyarchaeota archaeon]|nr:MFS transporter [Candidatus Bathyarchaeota archaeon]
MSLLKMKYKWLVLALLWISFFTVHFHRVAYSPLIPTIMRELGISYASAGLLMSAYFLAYTIPQIPMGILVDRFGSRKVISLFMMILAGGTVLFANITNFEIGFFSRFLIGFGSAAIWISGIKIISYWFKRSERGLTTGVFSASANFGATAALVIIPLVAIVYGWRQGYILTTIPIIVLIGLNWLLIRDYPTDIGLSPPENSKSHESEPQYVTSQKTLFQSILKNPYAWFLCISASFYLGGWYGTLTWIPTYCFEELKFPLATAGLIGSLIAIGAAISPATGILADKIGRKPVYVVGMGSYALFTFLFITFAACYNFISTIILAILMGISFSSFAFAFLMISELFPPTVAATASGVLNTFAFLGALVYPTMMGIIIDMSKSYHLAFLTVIIGELIGMAIALKTKETR